MPKLGIKAAHAYLSQTIQLNERIDQDVERSHALRTLMVGAPCVADGDQRKDIARELAELEARIIEDVDALVDLKTEIEQRIKRLADVKLRLVLELRYLCGRTWEQVAGDLNMSVSYVRHLHRRALEDFHRAAVGP